MRSINNPPHECKRLNLNISINGELYLSCALCAALKSALRGNPKPPLQDQKYIKSLNFEFTEEHFRTAESANCAVRSGTNGEFENKSDAEQKDAHGTAQRGATDEARESGGITDEKRARSKEAPNKKNSKRKRRRREQELVVSAKGA